MLKQYISVVDYLKGLSLSDLPDEHVRNINILIPKINDLLDLFGSYRPLTSGYRSPADQIRIYKEKLGSSFNISKVPMGSAHLVGLAIDLSDTDSKLGHWCLMNIKTLQDLGLYMEDKASTPNWIHLQCIAPKSGKTVFIP